MAVKLTKKQKKEILEKSKDAKRVRKVLNTDKLKDNMQLVNIEQGRDIRSAKGVRLYDPLPLINLGCQYSIALSKRGTGKTTNVLIELLKDYYIDGSEIALIKRYERDFIVMQDDIFGTIVNELNYISKLTDDEYNTITWIKGKGYLSYIDDDGKVSRRDTKPCIHTFVLKQSSRYKSTGYPNIKYILFDEFIDENAEYLPREVNKFSSILSTIIRDRDNVRIIMLGNPTPDCPYFEYYGLYNIYDMKAGDVNIYKMKKLNKELKFAVHMINQGNPETLRDGDVYFCFGDGSLNMLSHDGEWAIDNYPELPDDIRYKYSDIIFTFYVYYGLSPFTNPMQGDVVIKRDGNNLVRFIYMHRVDPLTPINEEDSLIYSPDVSPYNNFVRRINNPNKPREQIVWDLICDEKVFYDGNQIGANLDSYIRWCKRTKLLGTD